HHRRPALLDGVDHVVNRETLTENVGRVLDLAAARTGEVACEERFDLDDEREVLGSPQFVAQQVAADAKILAEGNGHQVSRVERVAPDRYSPGAMVRTTVANCSQRGTIVSKRFRSTLRMTARATRSGVTGRGKRRA